MIPSWHPCLIKASRISRPVMMSTTTIIYPPTQLWFPTNGDSYILSPNIEIYSFSQPLLRRAMLNDVRDYPEPHIFKPERFLKNGILDTGSSVRDPVDIAFGFGRRWALFILFKLDHVLSSNVITISGRICPGKHLAHSTLTLTAASVLSTFDLLKKVDENGREIEPKREYTKSPGIRSVSFLVLGFLPFTCHL